MCTTIRKAKKGLLNYFFHQTFGTNVGSVLPTRMDGPVCYINVQIGQYVTFTIAICITPIDLFLFCGKCDSTERQRASSVILRVNLCRM